MVPVNPTSSPSQVAPFFLAGFVYTLGSVGCFVFSPRVHPTHAAKPHQSSYPWRRKLEPPGAGETNTDTPRGAPARPALS